MALNSKLSTLDSSFLAFSKSEHDNYCSFSSEAIDYHVEILRQRGFSKILGDLETFIEGRIPIRFWGTVKNLYPTSLLLAPKDLRIIDVGESISNQGLKLSFYIRVEFSLGLYQSYKNLARFSVFNAGYITKGRLAFLHTRIHQPQMFLVNGNNTILLDACRQFLDTQFCSQASFVQNKTCDFIFSSQNYNETHFSSCTTKTELRQHPCSFSLSANQNELVLCPYLGALIQLEYSFPQVKSQNFSRCHFLHTSGHSFKASCAWGKHRKEILSLDFSHRAVTSINLADLPIVVHNLSFLSPPKIDTHLGPVGEFRMFLSSNTTYRQLSLIGTVVAVLALITILYKLVKYFSGHECCKCLLCINRRRSYSVGSRVNTRVTKLGRRKFRFRRAHPRVKELNSLIGRLSAIIKTLKSSPKGERNDSYSKNLSKLSELEKELRLVSICHKNDKDYQFRLTRDQWIDEIGLISSSISRVEQQKDSLHFTVIGRLHRISPTLLSSAP